MTKPRFGDELRRLRNSRGMSQADLAKRIQYSKSHLSRVESSGKAPSGGFVRLCDAELGAEGSLIALARRDGPNRAPAAAEGRPADSGRWLLGMSPDGSGDMRAVDRDGPGHTTQWARTGPPPPMTGTSLAVYERIFLELRSLGQTVSAAEVLPALIAHTHQLRVNDNDRPALALAARYSEYTGWMCQEAGDDRAAAWWTDRTAELAERAGDRNLGPYTLVRHALIALYRGDALTTIDAARAVQERDCSPRVRGLAAQREAQGHALAGDRSACLKALDLAADLLGTASSQEQSIGSWTVDDPAASARGWCLTELGHPAEAVQILERTLAEIPAEAVRSRARYRARLALALAGAADVDRACRLGAEAVSAMSSVDSATIRADLRGLRQMLTRWPRSATVLDLLPKLNQALVQAPLQGNPYR
jgi:transcriptional regulator with XRE-family HTH domain